MMKGEKGITLIALVITIIVMLILVVVTISFAINGGLFSNARTSVAQYRTAQINEAIALTKSDLYSEYYAKGNTGAGADLVPVKSGSAVVGMINAYLDGSGLTVKLDTTKGTNDTGVTTDATGTTYFLTSESDNIEVNDVTKTIVCDFWKTTTP